MKNKEMRYFASRLLMLRNIEDITQTELAKRINVSRSCLANYERGKRHPDNQMLEVIAGYFKVSVSYLTGEVDIGENNERHQHLAQRAKLLIGNNCLDIERLSLVQRKSIRDYLDYLIKKEKEAQ